MSPAGRGGPPRRVRITSPRTSRVRPRRSRYRDLEEQTGVGEVYVDSLLAAQRRLALTLLMGLCVLLGALPTLTLALRWAGTGSATSTVAWVGLGVLVYPVAWLLTRWFVRNAERVEAEFCDSLDRP